jgi:uncharacterized protein DUF5074
MNTVKHLSAFAAMTFVLFLTSCTKNQDVLTTKPAIGPANSPAIEKSLATGAYSDGFFLIYEGWYGHGTGGVNFYNYLTGLLQDSVYLKANPGKNLNPMTSTVEFGTVFNGNLYIVSKVGGPLVVCDQNTLVESARIPASSSRNWEAFVGIDSTHGLVSSGSGVYPLALPALTVGIAISGISGETGDMIKSGNYIFVLSESAGVVVLNASTYAIVKTIAGMTVAFARTTDGTVWAAGGTRLLSINASTLDTATVALPFTVNDQWAAWHPGSITASTAENAVFIGDNGTETGATAIYKYIVGTPSSLSTPFINIASGKETYGAGIGYDASANHLVVTTVKSGFGTNYSVNDLDIYNAGTGALITDLGYTGYYFPAILVFH